MAERIEEGFNDRVQQRVRENLALCVEEFKGYDRHAMRHMFSEFCHLETIAVMAAERGDGIEGQLEDEYVHFETFKHLAAHYGGLVEPCQEVVDLIDYLTGLDGEASHAALNVTAESWLETVFHHVGRWGCCDEMMRIIESDEERHARLAMDLPKPPVEEIEPIMRKLEEHLEKIAVAPAFMLPLIYFGGEKRVCQMGAGIIRAHERACKHFGIESRTHRVKLLVRSQRMWYKRKPIEKEMTDWDLTRMRAYKGQIANMWGWFTVPAPVNGLRMQARVIKALANILQRHPEWRVVTRQGKLFETQETIIGVRAMYDDDAVMNVFLPNMAGRSEKTVLRQLNQRIKKARREEYGYHAMPHMPDGLDELLPPPRVCAAVNYNGVHGGFGGSGPLSEVEGIPLLVTLGAVRNGECCITVLNDHRTHSGKQIGELMRELEHELTR